MNNKLRLTLLLQLVFFLAWAGWLFSFSSRTVAEFCLDTAPVDPRDLLSGTYLALRYEISEPKGGDCERVLSASRNASVYVQLGPDGRMINAGGKELPVYGALACAETKAETGAGVWARGSRKWAWSGRRLDYGIEKFFMNENDKRKNWSSGSFLARVQVDGLGNLRLVDLIEKPGGWKEAGAGAAVPLRRNPPPPPLPEGGSN